MTTIQEIKKVKRIIKAIDIDLEVAESGGIAYFRITPELKNFLSLCNKKHGIIGFEFEDGSFNFGVILDKAKDTNEIRHNYSSKKIPYEAISFSK